MPAEKIGKAATKILGVPADVTADLPEIILNSNEEAYIKGYKGLSEYAEDGIKLALKGKSIFIKGEKLMIKSIENEEIIIRGGIKSVEFL